MSDPSMGLEAARIATEAEPRMLVYEALTYNPYELCLNCGKANMYHDNPNHCMEDVDDC